MKKGFTLIEVMVAIVILAVLAGVVMAKFSKTRAKVSQRQAESYLRAIRVSQKMYYARYAVYACPSVGGGCNTASIKNNLRTEIKDGTYTFSLTSPSATTFTATADTTGSANDITLDQDGNFTKGGSAYTPP